MSRVLVCGLAVAVAACSSSDGSPGPDGGGRAFGGAVHVLLEGGTRRVALTMAADHPQLTISSQFHLRVAGEAQGVAYGIQLTLDPVEVGKRHLFPDEAPRLVTTMQRGGQDVPISGASGFLEVDARDEPGQTGAATCSLTLVSSSSAVAELDLRFDRTTR